jgi:hypothetical protein
MRRAPRTARFHGFLQAALLAAAGWLLPAAVSGAEIKLYEVKVPLAGTTEADRSAGFAEALRSVAVRVSGRREAATNATVAAADPARFVQRYSTSADRVLAVGFDGRSIEQLLQQAGLPFWAAERPVTVIEVPAADRTEALRAAQWRALPVEWSEGVRAGEPGPSRALLRGTPSGSLFDWSFTHAGQTAQGHGSLEDGVNLAADTLAARYAPASSRGTSTLVLRVGGMDGLEAYAGLVDYLESLSVVRDVTVEALEGGILRLRLTVRGDRELLSRIAALDGRLLPAAGDSGAAPPADFQFQP